MESYSMVQSTTRPRMMAHVLYYTVLCHATGKPAPREPCWSDLDHVPALRRSLLQLDRPDLRRFSQARPIVCFCIMCSGVVYVFSRSSQARPIVCFCIMCSGVVFSRSSQARPIVCFSIMCSSVVCTLRSRTAAVRHDRGQNGCCSTVCHTTLYQALYAH